MDRQDLAAQAFMDAISGFKEAMIAAKSVDYSKTDMMTAIAPMAAAIYRQLTQVVVVTLTSKNRPVRKDSLEQIRDVLRDSGLAGEAILASDDYQITFPDTEVVKLILREIASQDDPGLLGTVGPPGAHPAEGES